MKARVRSVGIASASRKEMIIIAIFYITSFINTALSAKRFGTAKRNFRGNNLRFCDFVIWRFVGMNILIILTNVSQMNTVAPSPLERVGVRSLGISNASRKEITIIAIV